MSNSFPLRLQTFLNELSSLEDRDERFDYLIELAERFKEVPREVAARPFSEAHKIPACESQAYIWCVPDKADRPKFFFAVENPQGISAKALAVVIDETLSGEDPARIQAVKEDMVYDIFGASITMGRGHGLMSMIGMAKLLATKLRDATRSKS